MSSIGYFIAIFAWLAGIVLAAGWWKIAAFAFPPYAWYLVVERFMSGWCS
jgi:hypothetical protein